MSGEHKQQAALERQRQEQVFVANVGREPSPDAVDDRGMTDLHHAAKLNLPALTIYLLGAGAAVDTEDDLARRRCTMRRWRPWMPKITGVRRRCTMRRSVMLLRWLRSCCAKGQRSTSEIALAIRRCTLRWSIMLLRPPRYCAVTAVDSERNCLLKGSERR